MKEDWKDIKGYEGIYQVSNRGCVRSLDRIVVDSKGVVFKRKGKELRLSVSNGYPSITLSNKVKKRFCIHRLVAQAFIENPLNKDEVNHIDGNKLNNNLSNLEWSTKSENTIHAYATGLMRSRKKL